MIPQFKNMINTIGTTLYALNNKYYIIEKKTIN